MNPLIYTFAAGIRAARLALAPKIARMDAEIARLEADLKTIKTNLETTKPKNRIIFTMTITDDSAARIKVQDKDQLGVKVTPGALTATVDQPAKAAVAQDPTDPTAFFVTRLPAADGDPAVLTVTVTITDTASGLTGTQAVEFDPGKAATMTFETTLAALPPASVAPTLPAVGDTVSLPSNPADPTSPPADHTVTAVDADASMITAQPVSGGDPVTVPVAAVAPAS